MLRSNFKFKFDSAQADLEMFCFLRVTSRMTNQKTSFVIKNYIFQILKTSTIDMCLQRYEFCEEGRH